MSNHAHVPRPNRERLLDGWLVHFVNHSDMAGFVTGLTVPKLNQGNLRGIPIPLPGLTEQRRIIAILDEAFGCIAEARENAEKNLRNARAVFESQLNAVLAARENPTSRPLVDLCDPSRATTYGVMKLGPDAPKGVACLPGLPQLVGICALP